MIVYFYFLFLFSCWNLESDCIDLQELRKKEKFENEKAMSLAQNDLSNLADEARLRHTEYSEQLTKSTHEYQEQLHSRDEQYVKLQDDYRSLHALLQRVQVEQSEQVSIFDAERKKYGKCTRWRQEVVMVGGDGGSCFFYRFIVAVPFH